MADQIQIVPHFHWDREWYFTTEESQILLVNDMEEIMSRLEQDLSYPCFILDGQTAILEDYFAVMPQARRRVEALVRAGKLIIGPWYTQTDEMVVGGESIVRNLLYGKLDCEPFGARMMIGYLPDSFGQSAAMPQILNGFGITRSMFWRGTSERMGTDKTEFLWRGRNGAEVTVQLLPLGYAIGKYLPAKPAALAKRLDKYLPVLDRGATTDWILLPNGHDQMPIQKDIFEIADEIEKLYPGRKCHMGRYESVFDQVEKKHDSLAVLSGEFLDGKYMRVHRSIYSTRADLKSANTRIENKITKTLEPLASIAWSLGFAYPNGLIETIWKELLKNHAHDSMGCCCSDPVHAEIAARYRNAERRTDELIRFYKRKIADTMPEEPVQSAQAQPSQPALTQPSQAVQPVPDKLVLFNLLPYPRKSVVEAEVVTRRKAFCMQDETGRTVPFHVLKTEIVDPGLIDRQIVHYGNYDPFVRYTVALETDLPAMGFTTFLLADAAQPAAVEEPSAADCLENAFYRITVNPNGTLQMLDKSSDVLFQDLLLLEDSGDDGDEYDYSPLAGETPRDSRSLRALTEIRHTALWDEAVIRLSFPLPADLAARREQITADSAAGCVNDAAGSTEVTFRVRLEQGSRLVRISADVDNHACDHRLRVLLPGSSANTTSVSDIPFGRIVRPVRDPAMDVWQQEHWSERPDSIYPFLSCVHGDSAHSMAVITNSVREYEMTGDDYGTLAVTLFRSVGILGKEELLRRPGRPSGIRMETPDSQMPGRNSYEFAICPSCPDLSFLANVYLSPVVSYNKMPYNAMKLNVPNHDTPYHYSLLSLERSCVCFSTLKKAEQEDALLLRLYNPEDTEEEFSLHTSGRTLQKMRLDETLLGGTSQEETPLNETPQDETPLGGTPLDKKEPAASCVGNMNASAAAGKICTAEPGEIITFGIR